MLPSPEKQWNLLKAIMPDCSLQHLKLCSNNNSGLKSWKLILTMCLSFSPRSIRMVIDRLTRGHCFDCLQIDFI